MSTYKIASKLRTFLIAPSSVILFDADSFFHCGKLYSDRKKRSLIFLQYKSLLFQFSNSFFNSLFTILCRYLLSTGWGISLRMVGVASKPVKPHTLSFAGFFLYVKRKLVADLKVIGLLMWK